jgi:hypothetical protein
MEFQCQPKPRKPLYYCPAYWAVLRQIAKVRLHVSRAVYGPPNRPMTVKELDRLCWGHPRPCPTRTATRSGRAAVDDATTFRTYWAYWTGPCPLFKSTIEKRDVTVAR